jgi:SWI/SNF-related matrix-associated actin-dependent regulator 1 of chromatin subfamily A
MATVKRQEGRRWHPDVRQWSLPASARCAQVLTELGFSSDAPYKLDAYDPKATIPDATRGSVTLYPYQGAAVDWLRRRKHALLWDAPGVGKTYQAVWWAADDPTVVVVCPLSVVPQWIDAVRNAAVSKTLCTVRADGKLVTEDGRLPEGETTAASPGAWFIVNYERLGKLPHLPEPYTLIVDEGTLIKNTKTQRSKAVLELGASAAKALVLTGSFIVNKPLEAWPFFLLCNKRTQQEFWGWAGRYTGAFQTPYGWDFTGATHLDELAEEIKDWAIRRELAEIAPQLPAKQYLTLRVGYGNNTGKVKSLAERVLQMAHSRADLQAGPGFDYLQELRLTAAVSKIPFLDDWLQQHFAGGGGNVLVFSAFKEPLRLLAEKRSMLMLTGDSSEKERAAAIAALNEIGGVMGLTYGAGGVGLNLQAASTVVLLDLPWSPTEKEQAEARAHRQGQKDTVQVIQLVGDHPVEQQMLQALDSKREIIEGILEFVHG